MQEHDLRVGMPLSYDVMHESGKGGEVRPRAVRIRLETSKGLGNVDHTKATQVISCS